MNESKESKRGRTGYGSTYTKESGIGPVGGDAIRTVLGGQAWKISPDKKAAAAHPCIWMAAGATSFKNCNNFYDCTSCKYDAGMKKRVSEGKQIGWQDAMRMRSALDRICRHSLTGRIAKRACAYDYQCGTCDFDQFFEDIWTAKTATRPAAVEQIRGFALPLDHYFHDGHTWARVESGGYIRIGLDDFALKLLGKADAFDLPLMGKELDQGKAGWGLSRQGNTADVLSPINGVIMEVNPEVRENPGLANREPYGGGWLFMVRTPDVKKTMKNLMAEEDSLNWIGTEINRLEKMIEDVAGPLAADGGYLTDDIYGALPDLGWDALTGTFLKS